MTDKVEPKSEKALVKPVISINIKREDSTQSQKNGGTDQVPAGQNTKDEKEVSHDKEGDTDTATVTDTTASESTTVTTTTDVVMKSLNSDVLEAPVDVTMGDDEGEEGEDRELSHQEAMAIYQKNLADIIQDDPLLCDLATTCTLEEVKGRVALEHGQAMTINVVKDTAEIMGVFVVQDGTVHDLKRAIRQHVTLHLERNAIHKPISWPYIWKSYWLYFEGQKLEDDRKKLKDYGIHNKAEVLFLKRLKRR